jgi:hypothetical protein
MEKIFSECYKQRAGLHSACKLCEREDFKKKYKENPEKFRERERLYLEKNQWIQKYRNEYSKTYNKPYYQKNKVKIRNQQMDYGKQYRKENQSYSNTYKNKRRKTDPLYKLAECVRTRIRSFLNATGMRKSKKSKELIGCTFQELKLHLEKQFEIGMAWDNHSKFGWHIDHKIPLCKAKTEEDIIKLCHYTNLQPLWWDKNLSKDRK